VASALKEQADRLFHCSNLYEIPQQEEVARILSEQAFPAESFFCNSGAEATRAPSRSCGGNANLNAVRGPLIITAQSSFHGRTLATLAATAQEKHRVGFDPIPDGFLAVPFGDFDALEKAVTPEVGGIMLEPIQGEGGINVPPAGYFRRVRERCDRTGILLVLDEIQTGMGRTGKLFGHQHEGITPDIMTLAKALGNGFPVGAVVARPEVTKVMGPGSHASTFGGNPLAMAASLATLKVMLRDDMPRRAAEQGAYLVEQLQGFRKDHPAITDVRGRGLMVWGPSSMRTSPLCQLRGSIAASC
jgi:acetylornithine/succinyldiaminopimelate/putrescine aminotransferase